MGGLELQGLGLYLDYRSDDAFVIDTQRRFLVLAERIETPLGIKLSVISGGSTNVFRRALKGRVVAGINQLRIGTAILLGIASSIGPIRIEDFEQDTFVLDADLIEVKRRKNRLVGILALGKLDAPKEQLFPVSPCASIIDATNDHTMIDLTAMPEPPSVGDAISFELGYSALNRLMASPYVRVEYR